MRGKFYYGQSGRARRWREVKASPAREVTGCHGPHLRKGRNARGSSACIAKTTNRGAGSGSWNPRKHLLEGLPASSPPSGQIGSLDKTGQSCQTFYQNGKNDGPEQKVTGLLPRLVAWLTVKFLYLIHLEYGGRNGQPPTANEGSSKRGCPGRRERNIKLP